MGVKSDIHLLEQEGEARLDKGHYRSARNIFERILKAEPNNGPAAFYLPVVYMKLGELAHALSLARRLIRLYPEELNVRLNIGAIYDQMGKTRLARKYYLEELDRQPMCLEAHYNLGMISFDNKRWRKASEHLMICLSMNHTIEALIHNLSYALYKIGNTTAEITAYREYLAKNPNDPWVLSQLGAALMDEGNYKEARLTLLKAQKLGEKSKALTNNLEFIKKALSR